MIEFDFNNKTDYKINQNQLKIIADKFSRTFYPGKKIQISTTIVSEKEIKDINQKYLGKDEITDVISLESKGDCQPKSLGEIIICAPVAKTQAEKYHHNLQTESEILFKHGLIHLLGIDHENNNDSQKWNQVLSHLERNYDRKKS